MKRWPLAAILMCSAASPAVAGAEGAPSAAPPRTPIAPATEAARAEAVARFDRALRLFNDGDNAAALAEFQQTYRLVPNPVVLYNIGLVHAAMGRPVEAVEAFDRLLPAPGSLAAEQVQRARAVRAAQADRIAGLVVKVNVEGAAIEVDNLDVARSPTAKPIEVASGTHVVTAVAPGYVPARKPVTVAGRATAEVAFELLPMQGRLAHLIVKSRLPAAEVLVDGQVAGETPLPGSLSLAPGKHVVEVRRAGYVPARRELELGDGAGGEIALDPEEDPVLAASDGSVALDVRETDVVVSVDGRLRGPYVSPLHLPGGLHRLRVERSGFFAFERDVGVPPSAPLRVSVELEPTPDTLAAYTEGARARRNWGWIGVAGGAALLAVGGGLVGYDASQRSTARSQYGTITSALAVHQHPCDFSQGDAPSACVPQINAAADSYNATYARDAAAYVIGGVGVVAIVTGAVLLATGGDPHRYEKKASGERIGGVRARPLAWGAPGRRRGRRVGRVLSARTRSRQTPTRRRVARWLSRPQRPPRSGTRPGRRCARARHPRKRDGFVARGSSRRLAGASSPPRRAAHRLRSSGVSRTLSNPTDTRNARARLTSDGGGSLVPSQARRASFTRAAAAAPVRMVSLEVPKARTVGRSSRGAASTNQETASRMASRCASG